MKKLFCIACMFVILMTAITCHAEGVVISADDDDIVLMLEDALAEFECDYSNVILNRKNGIIVIDVAVDGLTATLLALKEEGHDETYEQWVETKNAMLFLHASTLEMFKIVHRDDLRLIINIVNDDAYIREDYSTISHNPLLSIGVFGMVSVDEMAN